MNKIKLKYFFKLSSKLNRRKTIWILYAFYILALCKVNTEIYSKLHPDVEVSILKYIGVIISSGIFLTFIPLMIEYFYKKITKRKSSKKMLIGYFVISSVLLWNVVSYNQRLVEEKKSLLQNDSKNIKTNHSYRKWNEQNTFN